MSAPASTVPDIAAKRTAERDQLLESGFTVFRGLLDLHDITCLRRACLAYFGSAGVFALMGKTQPNAFHYIPDIRWLLSDSRILGAVRSGTARHDLEFTFHSDAHKDIIGGWHRDTDGYFDFAETLDEEFGVYKVAVYLEGHEDDDAGFTCRPGSHLSSSPDLPETVLHTAAGDVVLFDVRLAHHGQAPDWFETGLRLLRPASLQTSVRQAWAVARNKPSKLSIFYTYGVPNRFTTKFSERNIARQIAQHGDGGPTVSPELRTLLDSAGLPYCGSAV